MKILKKEIDDAPLTTDSERMTKKEIQMRFKKAVQRAQASLALNIEAMSKHAAMQVSNTNKEYNRRIISPELYQSATVNIFKESPTLKESLRAFAKENVALIQDVQKKMISRIEKKVVQSYQSGLRSSELGKVLQDEFGFASRRAKLIARDQIASLNSELTRERQSANGVEKFIWRSVGDERVRELHDEIDGEEYTWKDGHPTEGFPGGPINCRCFAEPVFE